MKKIIYFALAGSLLLGSCQKDFLDRYPQNSVPEDLFWKTPNDVYMAVNAIYATLPGEGIIFEDAAADIAHSQYPWESTANAVSSGIVQTTLNAGWNFETIRKANYFLENVDKATMDEALRTRYTAEVRFIRAMDYANKVNKFGDVALITSVVPTNNDAFQLGRDPKEKVMAWVLKELEEVAQILPVSYPGGSVQGNEKGRITKGAALAFKARFELQHNNFAAAAVTAKEVMGLGYQLFDSPVENEEYNKLDNYAQFVDFDTKADSIRFIKALRSYEGLFYAENEGNQEVILDRQYIKQSQPNFLNTYLPEGGLKGWSSVTPTQNLVNAYQSFLTGEAVTIPSNEQRAKLYKENKAEFVKEFKNRDPRFYATVLFETAPWAAATTAKNYVFKWAPGSANMSKTGYNFRKLVDPVALRENLDNYSNIILIRYAEILLTFAEAQNEISGPSTEIFNALDLIRERAGMPKVDQTKYGTKETLRQFIRNERLVELALEGSRYMDIRRWAIAPNVMKTIYDLNNGVAQTRAWDNKLMLMPVPQKEIDNAQGVLKQNPGY